jgi:type VI secretion system protein ImpJ
MMDIYRPLFWHQGLFLQPQHFQLLDLSYQSLLNPFQHFITPYFWGIADIEVQKASLGTRSFNLVKGEFLFPDGTHVVFPGNALLDSRSFQDAWLEGEKPFSIFIGIRKWNNSGENVTVVEKIGSLSDVTTRHITTADPEEIRDLHSGGPLGKVNRLHYVLKLFWESELDQLGDYVLIPLEQLVRMGEEIRLSRSFVPPSLSISSSETLAKLVKEIRDQIAARSRQLEEYKSQRGIQTVEFGTRDMVYLLALMTLNRYVPLLHHITEASIAHPWVVYGILRQLIGELSSFSERISVLGEAEDRIRLLPSYDHSNLWGCYSSAQTLITQLLDEITAGPEYVVPLMNDGTYYAAELKPSLFEGRNRYYLVFRTEVDPKSILQSLGSLAKLSSREYVPILIARALPGIGLEHLAVPPQELPRRTHSLYFAIDHNHDQWAQVERNHNIALYWDAAPEDLKVELMVVGR